MSEVPLLDLRRQWLAERLSSGIEGTNLLRSNCAKTLAA